MKTYNGRRDADGNCHVDITYTNGRTRPLPLRLDIENHSPTGFEWGYGGSGPAQLALAILADALGEDKRAARLHQSFKWKFIGALARDKPWTIRARDVIKWCNGNDNPAS